MKEREPKCQQECKHDDTIECCRARSETGMQCTRDAGHEGDHVACGDVDHDLEVWPKEDQP